MDIPPWQELCQEDASLPFTKRPLGPQTMARGWHMQASLSCPWEDLVTKGGYSQAEAFTGLQLLPVLEPYSPQVTFY